MDLQATKTKRVIRFTEIQEIENVEMFKDFRKLRAIEMAGDSMNPVIPEKSILLIDDDFTFCEGNVYLCQVKFDWMEELTVRRAFRKDYKNVVLKSYDVEAKDIIIPAGQINDVLLAEVVYIIRKPY